jgi:exoribonuclease R
MAAGGTLAKNTDRTCVNLVEAALLKDRLGEVFEGCVVEVEDHKGTVQLASPAVIGDIEGARPESLGTLLPVRLARADLEQPTVSFVPA